MCCIELHVQYFYTTGNAMAVTSPGDGKFSAPLNSYGTTVVYVDRKVFMRCMTLIGACLCICLQQFPRLTSCFRFIQLDSCNFFRLNGCGYSVVRMWHSLPSHPSWTWMTLPLCGCTTVPWWASLRGARTQGRGAPGCARVWNYWTVKCA